MHDPDVIALPPDAMLTQAAAVLSLHAHNFAAEALRQQPPGYQQQLMRAIDAGTSCLIVQCDAASGNVTVMTKARGGTASVLLPLEPHESGEPLPMQALAQAITQRALRILDADAEVWGELADGLAKMAVQADWPGDGVRVLLHRPGWAEPECVLELPGAADVKCDA